ncbi:MAG: methylmalonyl-CoA mutase family protein [Bacteroidales bacterium]|jgi:methylmalonyl-CoA mutase|nr:methylmalonyl-CoA mutase family protein [Bacteroidales bacterium]
MNNKDEKLFSEFPPVDTAQWEEAIHTDLKGADYDRKLKWKTDENFVVNPYYRAEDMDDLSYLSSSVAGEYPFVRGGKTTDNHWNIVENITEKNPQKANKIALDSLSKGAKTLIFDVSEAQDVSNLDLLLKNIDLMEVCVRFHHGSSYSDFAEVFILYIGAMSFLNKSVINGKLIRGSFGFDPISDLLLHNSFRVSQKKDLGEIIKIHRIMDKVCPHFQYVTVNGWLLHNCGATICQELGYALSSANEYLLFATENGMKIDEILPKIAFEFSISSNYFMEIAKLRAIRLLWSTLVSQYNPKNTDKVKMNIFSKSSLWNKTIYDPYVNMLRVTTVGMSAAIGGADEIELGAFDIAYKETDEFSRRIARNTQILLKEEAFFDKIVDPAAGSYYIEKLTDSIAEQTWSLFLETEKEGGMIRTALDGKIEDAITASCRKRDMDIATRKKVFVGSNQYPNTTEMMLDKVNIDLSGEVYAGLQPYRGATPFETLRLDTEKWAKTNGKRPKVFLLKTGNVAMRQARAGFIANFFGCAGYEIIDGQAFDLVQEGVMAALSIPANIVAICSSDEEYATVAPLIAYELKRRKRNIFCIVAGNPVEITETLKQSGIDDFIHVKLNLLDTLIHYNQLLGITPKEKKGNR